MVEGVLASCYPSNDHGLSQIGMSPMRLVPTIIEWIFGDDKTILAYVSICADLGKWLSPYTLNK